MTLNQYVKLLFIEDIERKRKIYQQAVDDYTNDLMIYAASSVSNEYYDKFIKAKDAYCEVLLLYKQFLKKGLP